MCSEKSNLMFFPILCPVMQGRSAGIPYDKCPGFFGSVLVNALLCYSSTGSWYLFIASLLTKYIGRPNAFYVLLLLSDLNPSVTCKVAKFLPSRKKNGVIDTIKVKYMLRFNFATARLVFFLSSFSLFCAIFFSLTSFMKPNIPNPI